MTQLHVFEPLRGKASCRAYQSCCYRNFGFWLLWLVVTLVSRTGGWNALPKHPFVQANMRRWGPAAGAGIKIRDIVALQRGEGGRGGGGGGGGGGAWVSWQQGHKSPATLNPRHWKRPNKTLPSRHHLQPKHRHHHHHHCTGCTGWVLWLQGMFMGSMLINCTIPVKNIVHFKHWM